MKRRLLALVFVPVVLLSLAVPFVHPAPAAAITKLQQQGFTACEAAFVAEGNQAPYCEDGWAAGFQGQPPPAGCSATASKAFCMTGYRLGTEASSGNPVNNGKSPVPPSNVSSDLQTKAFNSCNGNGHPGTNVGDCTVGYEWAFTTGKEPANCNVSCADGFSQGVTDLVQQGVDAKQNGQSDPCTSLSDTNKQKAACEKAFTTTTTPDNSTGSSAPSCEASGFSLSWILCPIIEGAASAADGIYSGLIKPLLLTKPLDLTNSTASSTKYPLYSIWSQFRIYGDIFLALALLVIVFGESIGGGLIDAYAAKKILPRLLIAAILINLSIYLVALAVDITNILGNGIAGLIEAPFHVTDTFNIHIGGATGDLGFVALVGGGALAWAGGGALLEVLLITVLIPAVLTFIAILITIVLRQGLIILLILLSPVAFALYCLPNTEKYFRQWWDLLVKTLLIYPLVAILFALGKILSVTINSTASGATGSLTEFLSIFALFAPLFLIPFSFRIAGGVLGRFHEFATQGRQKAHQAIVGNPNLPGSWRNRARGRLGMRYSEKGLGVSGIRTAVIPNRNLFERGKDGKRGGLRQWRKNIEANRAVMRSVLGSQYAENDPIFKTLNKADTYLAAVANPELAKLRRSQASPDEQPAWDQAITAANLTSKAAPLRMQAALALAGSGFQYSAGQQGYNEMAQTMASITGVQPHELVRENGNVVGATGSRAGAFALAMDDAQFAERSAGRFDLGGINHGAGYDFEAGITRASGFTGGNGKTKTYTAGAESRMGVALEGDEHQKTPELPILSSQIRQNILSGSLDDYEKNPDGSRKIDPATGQYIIKEYGQDKVARWHATLLDGLPSATEGNKAEIMKQIQAIEAINNGPTPDDEEGLNRLTKLTSSTESNRRQSRAMIDPNLRDNT